MLTQSGAPGSVIGWSNFSQQPATMLNIFFPSRCVILIPWFLWVLSQAIELSSSCEVFCSCFLVSFGA